jgi:hypothetical protein
MRKHNPVAKRDHAICGNVKRSKLRRPNVSMVQIAGQANTKLTSPKPRDAMRASRVEAPACLKMVLE